MSQLTLLTLKKNPIGDSGWQHLSQLAALRQLDIEKCRMSTVPAALAGLTCLSSLRMSGNPDALDSMGRPTHGITGGWDHLPLRLQELDASRCGLRQVPAELAPLQLTRLQMAHNNFDLSVRRDVSPGWEHLPAQLQTLDISGCGITDPPPGWTASTDDGMKALVRLAQ